MAFVAFLSLKLIINLYSKTDENIKKHYYEKFLFGNALVMGFLLFV